MPYSTTPVAAKRVPRFAVPLDENGLVDWLIDAKPGETYYLRLDAFRGYVLTRMPADLAAQEIVMTRAND